MTTPLNTGDDRRPVSPGLAGRGRLVRRGLAVATLATVSVAGLAVGAANAQTDESTDTTTDAPTPTVGAEEQPADAARPDRAGRRGGRGGPAKLTVAAEVIGVDADELRTEVRDGATLAEVAEANGVSSDAVVDAIVAAKLERLAEAVSDGRLTQEEADEKAADLEDRVRTRVESGRPEGAR